MLKAPTAAERPRSRDCAAAVRARRGSCAAARAPALPVVWSHVSGAGSVSRGTVAGAPGIGLAAATLQAIVGTGADAASTQIDARIPEAEVFALAA